MNPNIAPATPDGLSEQDYRRLWEGLYDLMLEMPNGPSKISDVELLKILIPLPSKFPYTERAELVRKATVNFKAIIEFLLVQGQVRLDSAYEWAKLAGVLLKLYHTIPGYEPKIDLSLVEVLVDVQKAPPRQATPVVAGQKPNPLLAPTVTVGSPVVAPPLRATPQTSNGTVVVPVAPPSKWEDVSKTAKELWAIAVALGRRFSKLPLPLQGTITAVVFLVVFGLFWAYFVSNEPTVSEADLKLEAPVAIAKRKPIAERELPAFQPADLKIGARRHEMTKEQQQLRQLLLIRTQTFYMLRVQDQAKGIEKVLALDPLVSEAVKNFVTANPDIAKSFVVEFNLPVENFSDLILAMIWKESAGNPDAKSPTGPSGAMQMSMAAAADEGICGPVYKRDDKGNLVLRDGQKIIIECSQDQRGDPKVAIPAGLNLLKKKYYELGKRLDLAIFAYHSGGGDVKKVIAAAKKDGLKWTSYYDLYFADPLKYPETYAVIRELSTGGENYGATYLPGVQRMMELIWVYVQSPDQYQKLVAAQRSKVARNINANNNKPPCNGDPRCAPYLAYSWYGKEDMKFKDTADLLAAINSGELTALSESDGILLRSPESGGIGDKATSTEEAEALRSLRPPAANAMAILGKQFIRFFPEEKLDITSAVRSLSYQQRVGKENISLEAHVTGMTFDISQKGMSAQQQAVLRFLLDEMQYSGLLSWIEEESGTYNAFHVVVSPSPLAQSVLGN